MKAKLSQFNFDLPEERIAQYPLDQRDESRLMVIHRDSGKIEHKTFKDIIDYFDDGDVFLGIFFHLGKLFSLLSLFPIFVVSEREKAGRKEEEGMSRVIYDFFPPFRCSKGEEAIMTVE